MRVCSLNIWHWQMYRMRRVFWIFPKYNGCWNGWLSSRVITVVSQYPGVNCAWMVCVSHFKHQSQCLLVVEHPTQACVHPFCLKSIKEMSINLAILLDCWVDNMQLGCNRQYHKILLTVPWNISTCLQQPHFMCFGADNRPLLMFIIIQKVDYPWMFVSLALIRLLLQGAYYTRTIIHMHSVSSTYRKYPTDT